MQEYLDALEEERWVVWNGSLGIRDFVEIGRVEVTANQRHAWLEEPYDMVGPLSVDALLGHEEVAFAACVVMSYQRWRRVQAALRRESQYRRQEYDQAFFEEINRFNRGKRASQRETKAAAERRHRKSLDLPLEGVLKITEIKAAYRRAAKSAHPDLGGNSDAFSAIKEAYDMLLKTLQR